MGIIALGRTLNVDVVAEGVETREELDYLRSNRCDLMQGYLFSRPVPADEFAALVTARAQDGATDLLFGPTRRGAPAA